MNPDYKPEGKIILSLPSIPAVSDDRKTHDQLRAEAVLSEVVIKLAEAHGLENVAVGQIGEREGGVSIEIEYTGEFDREVFGDHVRQLTQKPGKK